MRATTGVPLRPRHLRVIGVLALVGTSTTARRVGRAISLRTTRLGRARGRCRRAGPPSIAAASSPRLMSQGEKASGWPGRGAIGAHLNVVRSLDTDAGDEDPCGLWCTHGALGSFCSRAPCRYRDLLEDGRTARGWRIVPPRRPPAVEHPSAVLICERVAAAGAPENPRRAPKRAAQRGRATPTR